MEGPALPLAGEKARKLRTSFAFAHLIVLFMVLFPPFTCSVLLGYRTDAAYFVGRGPLIGALCLVPLVLVFPLLFLGTTTKISSMRLMTSLWVPLVIFALLGSRYRIETKVAMTSLLSKDCYSFQEKAKLQHAYEIAEDLYVSCTKRPGLEEVSVDECPGYLELERTWERQFGYLAALEQRFPCAGICQEARRFWHEPGRLAPDCGTFAAQWIWSAYVQALIVLAYSATLIALSIPAKLLLVDPLVHQLRELAL